MLKLNDVTWLYQHLPMRFTLDVARGERIAVLGPSGAGKSTLLNLIAGFLPPASGSLLINGEAHNATPPAQRPVSMLFQENNLFNHLTIRQNISLGIHPGLKLSREQQAQVTAIAGQMGIDALLERLEEGGTLNAEEQSWVDAKLDRIDELMQQLGLSYDDEDEEEEERQEDMMRLLKGGN